MIDAGQMIAGPLLMANGEDMIEVVLDRYYWSYEELLSRWWMSNELCIMGVKAKM